MKAGAMAVAKICLHKRSSLWQLKPGGQGVMKSILHIRANSAHQTLLTVSNVKHIHLGDCFKHHGYWAEFQGQIFQVPLPPYAGIIICYFISEDRK